jgi:hypothetical protein
MKRFVCLVGLFFTSPAAAEMLLAEIGYINYPPTLASPGPYSFGVISSAPWGAGGAASWHTWVDDNTNLVNEATPEKVIQFRAALAAEAYASVSLSNSTIGPYCPLNCPLDGPLWYDSPPLVPGLLIVAHVPRLGPALSGYLIERIVRTITPAAQIFSFYGTAQRLGYPPLLGDFDENGTVDAADYVKWRYFMLHRWRVPNSEGYNGYSGGDGHAANADDYATWRQHFGESVPPLGAASLADVPEPDTLVLVGLLIISVARRRFSRRHSA